jgi:hypothetical protein
MQQLERGVAASRCSLTVYIASTALPFCVMCGEVVADAAELLWQHHGGTLTQLHPIHSC